MTLEQSSGDLAADRRFQWGLGAAGQGDFEAARDLFAQTLERVPMWAPGWFAMAQALESLGRRAEAAGAYEQALALDEDDAQGAALCLAHLGARAAPPVAPRAFVKILFDQYAQNFDRHLVGALGYRGPEILCQAVERAAPGKIFAHALDLGCGAGLFGAAFRDRARVLTGVDLSPAMIFEAREKNLYDRLAAAEIVEFLQAEPGSSADFAAAADVFVYFGDLAPVFAAAARVLAPGGLLAFTVQNGKREGFSIGPDRRFWHGRGYVAACAQANGFEVVEISAASTRKDGGVDVPGWVAVLSRV
ncbi:methyltransferase domain-containing protein [uncultured Rhodoblastus sp.]|uniref:class I SAM-dependent DNA methyltransferase n=1 Tax=uncultured Rhodoblastus sp. TaxID=543037 RepID=UPI0025FF3852|nr:methyltransferase domain-containing protein [uncultured Rhodoblastus sp.]